MGDNISFKLLDLRPASEGGPVIYVPPEVQADEKLRVVVVAGPKKTGKTRFANTLLLAMQKLFTGHMFPAQTEGILGCYIRDRHMLVLDCQGQSPDWRDYNDTDFLVQNVGYHAADVYLHTTRSGIGRAVLDDFSYLSEMASAVAGAHTRPRLVVRVSDCMFDGEDLVKSLADLLARDQTGFSQLFDRETACAVATEGLSRDEFLDPFSIRWLRDRHDFGGAAAKVDQILNAEPGGRGADFATLCVFALEAAANVVAARDGKPRLSPGQYADQYDKLEYAFSIVPDGTADCERRLAERAALVEPVMAAFDRQFQWHNADARDAARGRLSRGLADPLAAAQAEQRKKALELAQPIFKTFSITLGYVDPLASRVSTRGYFNLDWVPWIALEPIRLPCDAKDEWRKNLSAAAAANLPKFAHLDSAASTAFKNGIRTIEKEAARLFDQIVSENAERFGQVLRARECVESGQLQLEVFEKLARKRKLSYQCVATAQLGTVCVAPEDSYAVFSCARTTAPYAAKFYDMKTPTSSFSELIPASR